METIAFHTREIPQFRERLLLLTRQYNYATILDSNEYQNTPYKEYDLLAGFGAKSIIRSNRFYELAALIKKGSWLFGYLGYDLKNELESLKSENYDGLEFSDLCFFEPEILVEVQNSVVKITGEHAKNFKELVCNVNVRFEPLQQVNIKSRITKEKYIKNVLQLLSHIQLGDIFEVNFCQEFYAENVVCSPESIYALLNQKSPVPFGSFLKVDQKYCLGASPERFIKKSKLKVVSQPIKGTVKRGRTITEDNEVKKRLLLSDKEKSENVMIVDLVRNDLSRFAKEGTVKVEELFGVYSFPQVHQMISTISCEVDQALSSVEILKNSFPMGSMTGAPKVRAMKLIEEYESTKRGLYSGAIGYIKPNGDFDFNVVIRSVLYNEKSKYLSFMVGGAITSQSQPQDEYEESLLKAKAIFEIFDSVH